MSTIERALEELREGLPIVLPTDTVYGLAVLPSVPGAIDEIYRIKGRPSEKPIPVLGASAEMLRGVVQFDRRAKRLAEHFWPGPLSLVLPRTFTFTTDLGGSGIRDNVAVRVPAHDLARDLLGRAGPLAATSANLSGEGAATTVDEARALFDDEISVFLDGGVCDGTPSTIVSLSGDEEMLREGAIPWDDIAHVLHPA